MTRMIAALTMLAAIMSAGAPARAFVIGGVVFDPSNYAQNVLTAANTLQQINNQIAQLQNEAQMLVNEATNLAHLSYSAAADIQARLHQIDALIQSARGIAFTVAQTRAAFADFYPDDYAAYTNQDMARHARTRWEQARHALHDALVMQAQITGAVAADTATLDTLISASQSAVGNLQVEQAGNQLVALNVKQGLQTQQLLAAQARAEAIASARAVASEERARVYRDRFLGDGAAYTR